MILKPRSQFEWLVLLVALAALVAIWRAVFMGAM